LINKKQIKTPIIPSKLGNEKLKTKETIMMLKPNSNYKK